MKSEREKTTCVYFKGSHDERYFFRKNMEIIPQILVENNIDFPDFVRRGEHKLYLEKENGKNLHSFCAWEKPISQISVS